MIYMIMLIAIYYFVQIGWILLKIANVIRKKPMVSFWCKNPNGLASVGTMSTKQASTLSNPLKEKA